MRAIGCSSRSICPTTPSRARCRRPSHGWLATSPSRAAMRSRFPLTAGASLHPAAEFVAMCDGESCERWHYGRRRVVLSLSLVLRRWSGPRAPLRSFQLSFCEGHIPAARETSSATRRTFSRNAARPTLLERNAAPSIITPALSRNPRRESGRSVQARHRRQRSGGALRLENAQQHYCAVAFSCEAMPTAL